MKEIYFFPSLIVFMIIFGTLVATAIVFQGKTQLEPGVVYEVKEVKRPGQYCYLWLGTNETVELYRLPLTDVPIDLESGDGLVKLPTGLTRLPHEFNQTDS